MRRIPLRVCIALVVLGLFVTGVDGARAAGPPVITKVQSQVSVLQDGMLDIKYDLTFRETESRSGITTMGPFDSGHEIVESTVEHDGQMSVVEMSAKGSGFYSGDFGFDTSPGVDYTVHVRYRVPYALDETTINGEPYRVLEWSPIEWNLEIGEQIATLILPIELPS